MKLFSTAAAAALAALVGFSAHAAENYPAEPIRIVVPFGTGGTTDILGRLYARHLEENLGQPAIVVNRPGAAGNIGIAEVARAEPTGYTIGIVPTGILAINQYIFDEMPFDAEQDLVAVAPIATTPSVMFVNGSLPVETLQDFIEYARNETNQVSYGTAGFGSTTHLAATLLSDLTGIEMVNVPYNSAADFTIDLVSGEIQMVTGLPSTFVPHLPSGAVKALVVASGERSALLPDVPSSTEAGLPEFVASTWYGIVAPAGTPAAVVDRLNELAASFAESEEGRKALQDAFMEPLTMSHEEFTAFVASESALMEQLVETIRMQAE